MKRETEKGGGERGRERNRLAERQREVDWLRDREK